MRWLGYVTAILWWSGIARSLSSMNRGYKISPKPCRVAGQPNVEGTCMFVWECIKSEGIHVGVCVDTFMFGSCCVHNVTSNSMSASNGNQLQTRPSLAEALAAESTSIRPQSGPSAFTSHVTTLQAGSQAHTSLATTRQPARPVSNSRPYLQKRPHSKPNSPEQDYQEHMHNASQITRRPGTQEDRHHGSSDSNHHHHHHQGGFKDKVSNSHHTLLVRLPNKNSNNQQQGSSSKRPYHKPGYRPYQEDDQAADEQAQHDLSVQESVHRPSINSVDDDEASDKLNNLNLIHTERPPWATKPQISHARPEYSKPYFSMKTTSSTTAKTTTTHRPSSITTPASTSYYSGQPTSAAGSASHWQVTTEPAFVTRHKQPSSSGSNAWTHKPQHKPQWTDPQRPSFKPTEPQENNIYQKPHSAHYITTSFLETPTKARPTKKPSTTTTTSTPISTTRTSTTTTTTAATTTESSSARTGSVLTVPAAAENSEMSCGMPPLYPRPETRIVGGKEAGFGKWPWQVSVRRTSFFGFSSTHRCGGAVLNENWIATAGHCVDDLLTSQIRIRVGEYDFSSVQERLPYVERGIAKKVVHPKYNFFTFEYDLALVRLETPLNFAPHISPICLPASDELLVGENATVTGWGRLSEGGTLPSVLQEVSVPIVSNDKCKSMFLKAGRHEFIPEIFLCAGYETGGQDSCQGDSGGPLQVRGKDGRYFLAGIISWGIGCAEANLPGVCTRISKFVPWILKNVT
ncbi:serine proteinase stubble-like isoform X2 [Phymastichus coffea]|nr:serine proteinase stubble-like isoform X2 [Phymastichus coffea]XP_058800151.1 serine proteinase stubble-like isoform X2 [Phymastichus coffea]XP_058800152.1 serine proteinase stubble-like isoform X2 [Phymastichus coffea]XP_058800153.1 serine proteinase stubble-like isoform X2 [Phymastichus coffea]